MADSVYDVIIVGAGPAGLSAALILGRCRRRVLICDIGNPRNAASHSMHGFLTRDGIEPSRLRLIGRDQLARYETIEFRDLEVVDAEKVDSRFLVQFNDGSCRYARRLLLATGVVDQMPDIEGVTEHYGKSLFHCPYCDGWEVRDQPIAVLAKGKEGFGLALELTLWSRDLVLCSNGPSYLRREQKETLQKNGIPIREERIARLEGTHGMLDRIVFRNGEVLRRSAAFFNNGQHQRSSLPEKFGCKISPKGDVQTGRHESTDIEGLYVAGDASRNVQFAIIAAAEGAEAAYDINTGLLKEDLIT